MAEAELTKEEQEYLEIVKRLVKNNDGELEGERPLLDRQREFFGVSEPRARYIEQRVVSAYQTFLQRQTTVTDRRSLPAAPTNELSSRFSSPQERQWFQPTSAPQFGSPLDNFPEDQDDPTTRFTPTYLPSTTPPAEDLPPTVVSPPPVTTTQLAATTLSEQPDLERALSNKDWQKADQITLTMMLKLANCEAEGWLNAEAIRRIPCSSLHGIDRLWGRYSHNKFGFTPQWQVYSELERSRLKQRSDARSAPQERSRQQPLFSPDAPRPADLDYQKMLSFCKAVGWWQWGEFHKYYNQLAFRKYDVQPALVLGKEVPRGHLPALWYWQIPWWRALQLGGVGSSRGGCRVDAEVLVAFMTQLQECEVSPKPDADNHQLPDFRTNRTRRSS